MKRMNKNTPEIAISIIVENEKVLLVERKHAEPNNRGSILTWVFPGGKIRLGETPDEAAIRETIEETGYKVETTHRIAEGLHPDFPVYVFYIACQIVEDSEKELADDIQIKQAVFISKSQVHSYITSSINTEVAAYLGIG